MASISDHRGHNTYPSQSTLSRYAVLPWEDADEYWELVAARAVEKLELLPDVLAIIQMIGDYSVMREQTKACRS